eukprot:TRINITY_DN1771_c0_g1_i2.p1 TRINITY_DN1771_c0_g1~~TRINITY_DN1771_c0_g1_i2.p1  ORF type:complete len:351 (+),score=62.75 TRINITY_DN1771_c0_g1_i2:395-1447(+)
MAGVASSASYVMSTKALLVSVGAASPLPAIPAAAAISWVLKDGLGSLGMMFLASRLGTRFDSDTKRNKWRADVLHNCGVGLELCTPLVPSLFLPFASMANLLKGLAGITNGATRASFNKHFAQGENLGDLTAKAQTQGITAYLVGMTGGIGLSFMSVDEPASLPIFGCFGLLAAIQLYASFRALSSVQLKTLNLQRTSILIDRYLSKYQTVVESDDNQFSPESVSKMEKILLTPDYLSYPIRFGTSIDESLSGHIQELESIISPFIQERYFVHDVSGTIVVVIHRDASSLDILKAYFHAYCQAKQRLTTIDALQFTNNHFHKLIDILTDNGWNIQHSLLISPSGNRAFWK